MSRKIRSRCRFAVAGVLVALSVVSVAVADGVRMEEIAMAWVEAHNSGDEERMASFRRQHLTGADENWRDSFERRVDMLGHLEPAAVMVGGSDELVLVCESEKRGVLRFTFEFSTEDPERISGIAIDTHEDAEPNELPRLELEGTDWRDRSREILAYIEKVAAADLFSGAVLVGEGDEVRFEGAYGLASREFGAANSPDTRFDIGSITKDFTRIAIAQLAAAGKLGLDDKLGEHLPEYPNAEAREKVTIRQLFEHASGIGDYFTEEWGETPMGALRDHGDYIAIWGPKPLEFEPGSRQSYSNFGFTLLGAIIERVSGRSYFDYVAEHVFEPAGMEDCGFFATDEPVRDVAVGYTYWQRGGERGDTLRKNIYHEPVVGGPWGKTYCTAGDLWRFWQALRHHRLTSPDYTDWVLLNGPPPDPSADPNGEPGEGEAVVEVGLGGGGPGINAELIAFEGRVVIVLANVDPPVARNLAQRLVQALTSIDD